MPPLSIVFHIILLIILLIFSALFSAWETAFSSVSLAKIEDQLSNKKNIAKKAILNQYKKFPTTLATILIGNNIVNIASSLILSAMLSKIILSDSLEVIVSTAVMTPLIVIFGEIFPKMIARKKPISYLTKTFWIMQFFYYLFWPITFLINKFVKNDDITNTESELKQILKIGYKEGVLEKDESILAMNALDFDSVKLNKHYVRMKDITFINIDDSNEKVKETFKESGFSRIPVMKKDKFIGILLLKDIFNLDKFDIEDLLVEVPLISVNSLLKIALKKMKESKTQFGFVTKSIEDKEIIGIITLEDILEEIVGEIYDEHDFRDNLDIYEMEEDRIIVNYSTPIEEINEKLNISLPLKQDVIGKWLEQMTNKKINLKFKFIYDNKLHFQVIENKRKLEPKIEIVKK